MILFWGFGLALVGGAAVVFSILLAKTAQARRASKNANCYYCGNPSVRLSSPDQWIDPLLAHWHCVPHRCDVCYRRQHRYQARARVED